MQYPKLPVSQPIDQLVVALDEALGLLKEFSGASGLVHATDQSPASLLDQCLALCEQQQALQSEPIRTVHQFACAGGTLMSKCIAAMPNVQLLSEVDPLSTMLDQPDKPRFAPSDFVTLLRQSTRGVDSAVIIELFLNNLGIIFSEAIKSGQRLILRDHAHSHFCMGSDISDRQSFRSIITSRFPTVSVITVRHPVDSFLSLKEHGWIAFNPATFDEYCRRYVAFLQSYDGIPIVRYEDFVESPHSVMSNICDLLELPYSDQFIDLFSVFKLTGDSGRGGNVIELRQRRSMNDELVKEIRESRYFFILKKMLNYEDKKMTG